MYLAEYVLKEQIKKLEIEKVNCSKTVDLSSIKSKVKTSFIEIFYVIDELHFCFESLNSPYLKKILIEDLKEILLKENNEEIESILTRDLLLIQDFATQFDTNAKRTSTNLWRYVNYGQYLSIGDINTLLTMINKDYYYNIFDTRCGEGKTLLWLKPYFKNANFYGNEEDTNKSTRARQLNVGKIISGSLEGSRISNECFDLVICNPPYNTAIPEQTGLLSVYATKQEKIFLYRILKYIRKDGLLCFIIPYFRLYKDICLLMSKYFKNCKVFKTSDFDTNKTIMIIGQLKTDKEIDEKTYKTLRSCYDIANIKNENDEHFVYELSNQMKPVDLFRGSILSEDELTSIINHSNCYDQFWNQQHSKKITDQKIQPLLPFNIGQIGLVLTSGCLDGIIDEGDGHQHLIKGRVTKQSEINNTQSGDRTEREEVISNKVEINAFLPDGTFKVLA